MGMEECGHYVLPRLGYFSSTLYASTVLLAHRDLGTIRDELSSLPTFFSAEKRVDCPEASKCAVMQHVIRRTQSCAGQVTTIDGVRIDWEDGWLLVRPSGTSPYMKVNAEASSPERLEQLSTLGMSMVNEDLA